MKNHTDGDKSDTAGTSDSQCPILGTESELKDRIREIIDGEAVAFTDAIEDELDAESLFEMLSVGAGGEIVLRKLCYSNPEHTGYLKTVILKSKK